MGVDKIYGLQSKLDKHSVTEEGEANDYLYDNNATEVELNGLPGRSSDSFESPIAAWWASAGLRHTDDEVLHNTIMSFLCMSFHSFSFISAVTQLAKCLCTLFLVVNARCFLACSSD